jgi:hypothetical protein
MHAPDREYGKGKSHGAEEGINQGGIHALVSQPRPSLGTPADDKHAYSFWVALGVRATTRCESGRGHYSLQRCTAARLHGGAPGRVLLLLELHVWSAILLASLRRLLRFALVFALGSFAH